MRPYLRNLQPLLLLEMFASEGPRGASVVVLGGGGVTAAADAVDEANGSLGAPERTSELNGRRWCFVSEEARRDRSMGKDIPMNFYLLIWVCL